MEPKYSILLSNQDFEIYKSEIDRWLRRGIKVIWFSQNDAEVNELKSTYQQFAKIFLLMAYTIPESHSAIIVDGNDENGFVEKILSKCCPLFNSAQYMVEHCLSTEHIIVQASAGTGKTTVMVDRILYLLHMFPDLHLSEIFMITFTNEAADQMNKRLQDVLLRRYELTKELRYLKWVEEQSQMHISTIHSFAFYMLKEYGIGESFTKNLEIRGYKYEKTELIKDEIDLCINENHTVKEQLGLNFYNATKTISSFWRKLGQLGVSYRDIPELDWGEPDNKSSIQFHEVISNMIEKLDTKYSDIKRIEEGIGVDDIIRDLQEVLLKKGLPMTDVSMKYLFIDEFQDTDLAQINVACLLVKMFNPSLFVVGDVKQSIYRFRGATDQAFNILRKDMASMELGKPRIFTLVNNYRTSANVLKKMDTYFFVWNELGQLKYDKPVIPFNKNEGRVKIVAQKGKDEVDEQISRTIEFELAELEERINNGVLEASDKSRVVILARTKRELRKAVGILREAKIPAQMSIEGAFYTSEAVMDFYLMVSSFLFDSEPKHIFNFLLTPYAGEVDPMNVNEMEWLNANKENLCEYLNHFLEQTEWKYYHKELRLRPVLAVLKEMVDNTTVVENYIINTKRKRLEEGWEEERAIADTYTKARQYQANLEKLLELIEKNLGGEKLSLFDLYNFLKLNIATNREEDDAYVQSNDDYHSVLCMTVHKSKGLEFETVVIPFTDRKYILGGGTELLVDSVKKQVGWNIVTEKGLDNMKNTFYDDLQQADAIATEKEETRILYVAMTRAITNLIIITPRNTKPQRWSYLLEEVGIDYE